MYICISTPLANKTPPANKHSKFVSSQTFSLLKMLELQVLDIINVIKFLPDDVCYSTLTIPSPTQSSPLNATFYTEYFTYIHLYSFPTILAISPLLSVLSLHIDPCLRMRRPIQTLAITFRSTTAKDEVDVSPFAWNRSTPTNQHRNEQTTLDLFAPYGMLSDHGPIWWQQFYSSAQLSLSQRRGRFQTCQHIHYLIKEYVDCKAPARTNFEEKRSRAVPRYEINVKM